jgi:hypothetical protein
LSPEPLTSHERAAWAAYEAITRSETAMAQAGADFAISLAAEAVDTFESGQTCYGQALTAIAIAGAEAQRVVLSAKWPFLDDKAGSAP